MVAVASAIVAVAIEGDMDITLHFRIRHDFLVDPLTEGVAFEDSTGVLSGGTTEFTALFDIIGHFSLRSAFESTIILYVAYIHLSNLYSTN